LVHIIAKTSEMMLNHKKKKIPSPARRKKLREEKKRGEEYGVQREKRSTPKMIGPGRTRGAKGS